MERTRSGAILRKPKLVEFGSQRKKINNNQIVKKEDDTKISREKLLERRGFILNELFKTEATYVEYLQVAINLFLRPIEKANPGSKPYLPTDKREQIFQNIEQLAKINAGLLQKMAIRKTQCNGAAFGPNEVWLDLLTDAFSQVSITNTFISFFNPFFIFCSQNYVKVINNICMDTIMQLEHLKKYQNGLEKIHLLEVGYKTVLLKKMIYVVVWETFLHF